MTTGGAALFATAETARTVERTRAIVALIGGYDGSGNYGDIALLDAALGLVERLGPSVVALPVLERQHLEGHRRLHETAGIQAPAVLFFDPGDEGEHEDDLLPVAAPVELAFGAGYLYGGGYLNRLWGARKLAMLNAAEALLATGGAPFCRLSSGLQVEPSWLGKLTASEAAALDGLDPRGGRDSASREELSLGQDTAAVNTGDDAIGVLGRLSLPGRSPDYDGRLRINLHFAEHDWVTERGEALLDFYVGFVVELGRLAGRAVTVQPLIAYLDERTDERPGVEKLAAACTTAGVEVADPLVLRPASLAAALPQLRTASMTLSCSYHVALTSLMLEVPAVLIGDNAYYEQKAAGLREDFGLPSEFSGPATANPTTRAGEIAAVLLDAGRSQALRNNLTTGAERLRQRRTATEAELLGRLGRAAVTALDGRVNELTGRVGQLAGEPAELHMRLANLQSETERLRRLVEESPIEAELRAQEAETRAAAAHDALEGVLQSRPWRLLAPLRRLKELFRRS